MPVDFEEITEKKRHFHGAKIIQLLCVLRKESSFAICFS